MTRMIAAVAAAAFLSFAASSALAKDDPELRAAAESYIQHPITQGVLDSMSSVETMRSGLVSHLKAEGTTLSSDQIELLSRILQEEFARIRPQFETALTNAAIETYSLKEIQALNEFYSSDVGASAMMKSGMLMRSFNAGAASIPQEFYKRLDARIDAAFPE